MVFIFDPLRVTDHPRDGPILFPIGDPRLVIPELASDGPVPTQVPWNPKLPTHQGPCDWPVNDMLMIVASVPEDPDRQETVIRVPEGVAHYYLTHMTWREPFEPLYHSHIGDGGGLFALKEIPPGGTVVHERPILVFDWATSQYDFSKLPSRRSDTLAETLADEIARLGISPSDVRIYGDLEAAVDWLKPDKKAAFYSLKRQRGESGGARAIIEKNGLFIELPGTERDHGAICEYICNARHSCVPNAAFEFVHKTLSYHLTALRTIEVGEEVTVAFCEGSSKADRAETLKECHELECACPACQDPTLEKEVYQAVDDFAELRQLALRILDFTSDSLSTSSSSSDFDEPDRQLVREYRRLARSFHGEFGPAHDDSVPLGRQPLRQRSLKRWLQLEVRLATDLETAMEVAVEGRRLAVDHTEDWAEFDRAVKSGCSAEQIKRLEERYCQWHGLA